MHAVLTPGLCIVGQGLKTVSVAGETYEYDATRMIACSMHLPAASQVVRASRKEPFLALRLDLDPAKVAELALQVHPNGFPQAPDRRAVRVWRVDPHLVDAAVRFAELIGNADDARVLAPIVKSEILVRLLRSPLGDLLAQVGHGSSYAQRIARATVAIRDHFSQPINVGALAKRLHMSVVVSPALSGNYLNEPAAISEGAAAAGGEAVDVVGSHRGKRGQPQGGLCQRLAVQPRISSTLRLFTGARRGQAQERVT
jgi:hypothetical protein